jgi:CubicO group peptidase (beta-lactamase class C family)
MTHSTYSQPLPDAIRKSAASGYRGNGKVVDGKIHIYPEMAAAGLWTTPTDLAKFAIEVLVNRDKGYGAVVMVNSDNGQIMDEILRGIAREYQWEDYLPQPREIVPVDPARLQAYTAGFSSIRTVY